MSSRGEQTKAAILDAAVARIVAHGLEGVRIRDVAQDVGINNATLHHHFPTKAALLAAIVLRFVAGFKLAARVPADGPLEDRLAAYVALRRAQIRQDPTPSVVFCELFVLARRDDEARRLMTGLQDSWRDYIASVCLEAGLSEAAALERADRCRRELLGLALDVCVGRGE